MKITENTILSDILNEYPALEPKLLALDPRFADAAAECGLRSFQMMAGALEGKELNCDLLAHQGPFGVGYGVASFVEIGESHALA